MTEIQNEPEGDVAKAFEDLRGEVSLTRRALEGLTAARERTPDYSIALGEMNKALDTLAASLARVEESPAMRLSPGAMAGELVKASVTARAEDVRLLHEARDHMLRSTGMIDGMIKRGQCVEIGRRRLVRCGVSCALAGMLFWSIFPGALARALPTSWHVPEWMAARTMRLEARPAGERLIALARPVLRAESQTGSILEDPAR